MRLLKKLKKVGLENKMIKLIIKNVGMFLNIPGITPFRTPAEIDITKVDVNMVLAELKKHGISKYKIVSSDPNQLKSIINKISIDKKKVKESMILKGEGESEILISIKEQQKSIDKITKILEGFLKSEPTNDNHEPLIKEKRKRKKFDEKVEEFIPSIDIDSYKLKGSITNDIIKVDKKDYKTEAKKLQKYNK